MTRVFVESVGLFGTGFESWAAAQPILRGDMPYKANDIALPSPEWLPPAERRRTSDIIKLALCAGREALTSADQAINETYTVFTSSGGSGEVIHQICEALATPERDVSPTRFHNSVHNAPAGYWGIATRSEWPSTSLCAHDASFAAGLLEAVAQTMATPQSVLLLAHDLRYPAPLDGARPVAGLFSIALLLNAAKTAKAKYALELEVKHELIATRLDNAALEHFRANNPAARSLPLLVQMVKVEKMANGSSSEVVIDNVNHAAVRVKVSAP
jgi:hypothetical protein